MTGLYFYKLVSPYEEDVTKDCKLTVNEIDHNFVTLKDADIKDAVYDDLSNIITLTRNNGETMELDISSIADGMTTNLDVDYDSVSGTITITYNDRKAVIDGIITKDNLSKEILTEVISDSTLKGKGTYGRPLGISPVEFTGVYKPAKRFIDLSKGEFLPKVEHLSVGDRFVTFESANDYGFLYNFNSVKKINEDLCHGWRVPSKEDWDNMLNAIEPCDTYRTHDSQMANIVLGKVAGKLLKKKHRWAEPIKGEDFCNCDDKFEHHHDHHHHCSPCEEIEGDDFFDVDEEIKKELKKKHIDPRGIDNFKMGLLPAGYGDGCRIIAYFGKRGEYWSTTMTNALDVYTKRFDFDKAGVVQNLQSPSALFSVRLVKDYDGQNFHEVESINGQDYPCVLVPCANSEHGFAIWTAMNLSFSQTKYKPVLPNNGEGLGIGAKHFHFLYAWNGKDFVKKRIEEGESIVLEHGLEGEHDAEYRLMHGKLVNVNDIVYHAVMKAICPRIDRIEDRLDEKDEQIEDINNEINAIKDRQDELETKLNQEILDRQEVDAQIWESLNNEIEGRLQVDAEQWEAINNETTAREKVEAEIWTAINEESSSRLETEKQIWESLNNEIESRLQVDKEQWDAINAERENREKVEAEIWTALNSEVEARETVDKEQWDAINDEIENRLQVDKEQWDAINAERENREKVEAEIWESLNSEIEGRLQVDKEQWDAINNESAIREEIDNQIWEALNNEIARATEREDSIENRLIVQEGSEYDLLGGKLTLSTFGEDTPNIIINLDSNYGTF